MLQQITMIKYGSIDMSEYNHWKLLQATFNCKCDCEDFYVCITFSVCIVYTVEDPVTGASHKQM